LPARVAFPPAAVAQLLMHLMPLKPVPAAAVVLMPHPWRSVKTSQPKPLAACLRCRKHPGTPLRILV